MPRDRVWSYHCVNKHNHDLPYCAVLRLLPRIVTGHLAWLHG